MSTVTTKLTPEKTFIIDELVQRVQASPFLIVIDYSKINVAEFEQLRTKLKEVGAKCIVAKNRYINKALELADKPDFSEKLKGQNAYITGESDICAAAKVVKNFIKESKKAAIVCGLLEEELLDDAKVIALAELPSKEVLLAQLLGVINEPATKLLRTINEPGASVARIIQNKYNN